MTLLLAILAAWRLARMVIYETGPFALFERIRFQIFKRIQPGGWIEEGFSCVLCVSFWSAFLMAFFVSKSPADFILNWFGIAGGAALIHLLAERD